MFRATSCWRKGEEDEILVETHLVLEPGPLGMDRSMLNRLTPSAQYGGFSLASEKNPHCDNAEGY